MRKPAIGIYIPRWFCNTSEANKIFARELVQSIDSSSRYRALLLNLPKLSFSDEDNLKKFVEEKKLTAILQHDSPFFRTDSQYSSNIKRLGSLLPIFNSYRCQEVGHDKISTKKLLRKLGLPVLDDKLISSLSDLENYTAKGGLYVVKPHNSGSGEGVKLFKKEKGMFWSYDNRKWHRIQIIEGVRKELKVKYKFHTRTPFLFLNNFTYSPMMLEPYFNDSFESFSSLRCTVVGDEVVEAVKRTNEKNITSNVSHGGRAEKIELSDEQKLAAIGAKNAVGAFYAGVDFLIRGKEWVIGEVNIGPISSFSKYTGVNVGKILGEHLMKEIHIS